MEQKIAQQGVNIWSPYIFDGQCRQKYKKKTKTLLNPSKKDNSKSDNDDAEQEEFKEVRKSMSPNRGRSPSKLNIEVRMLSNERSPGVRTRNQKHTPVSPSVGVQTHLYEEVKKEAPVRATTRTRNRG